MALHLTTDHSTLCSTPHHRQHDPAECAVPCSRRSCTPTTGRPPSAAPPRRPAPATHRRPRQSRHTTLGGVSGLPPPTGQHRPPLPAEPPCTRQHEGRRTGPRGASRGPPDGARGPAWRRAVEGAGGGRGGGARGVHVKRHPAAPSPPTPPVRMDVAIFHLPFASLTLVFPITSPPSAARRPPPATLALATAAPHTCTPPGTLAPHPRPLAPCSPAAAPGYLHPCRP